MKPLLGPADLLTLLRFPLAAACQVLTLVALIAESPLTRPLAWATAAVSVYAIWDYGQAASRRSEPRPTIQPGEGP